jgi:hypothetical protein
MRTRAVLVAVCVLLASTFVLANNGKNIEEVLSGYEETPLTLSTTGTGEFHARIDARNQTIEYELSYEELEGEVTQAHIHLGAPGLTGGVAVFLCTNLGNGPVGTQACPAAPATITGTIRPADIIGPAGQGLSAQEFAGLIQAMRAGVTYVNVHTSKYPAGEIRSQINHKRHKSH